MRKLILLGVTLTCVTGMAQTTMELEEVTVTSIQRNKVEVGSLIDSIDNYGQSPDRVIERLPGVYAYGDNGTPFGYSYFRMRGMDQGRINVSLDGIPWNEAEDFGCYFSNIPDLMASLKNMKVERGASITMNGVAAYAGNISLESIDLRNAREGGMIEAGAGSFGSYRLSGSYVGKEKRGWSWYVRATTLGTDGYREHSYNDSKSLSFKVSKEWQDGRHTLDLFSITGKHNNGQGYQGVTEDQLPKHNTPFKQVLNGCNPQETDNFMNTYNRLQYRGYLSPTVSLVSTLYWTAQKGDYRIGGGDWLNNYHLVYNTLGGSSMIRWYPREGLKVEGGVNAYYYRRDHKGYDLPGDTVIRNFKDKGFPVLYQNYGVKPDYSVFGKVTWKGLEASLQFRETSLSYHVQREGTKGDQGNKHTWDIVNASLGYSLPIGLYIKWSMIGKEPSRTDLFGGEYFTGEYTLKDPGAIERVQDVEFGWEVKKSEKVKANVNLYYMGFYNELVATGELVNGLPMHSQQDGYRMGVEGSVTWKPLPCLAITENLSWSENKLSDYKTHPYSPAFTSFSEVAWRINNKVALSLNASYHTKAYLDLENTASLPEAFSLGATAEWKVRKGITANLRLNNITNKRNLTAGSIGEDGQVYYIIDAPFNMFGGITVEL